MKAPQDRLDNTAHFKLRRCILELLYKRFKEVPLAQVELSHIEEMCETDASELNWNMVYLEKCGYIDINKAPDCVTHVGFTAAITSDGVDLVENRADFEHRFPTQDTC